MNIRYYKNFGYQSFLSGHHFQVIIPKQKNAPVTITENYVQPDLDLPPVISDMVRPRVILDRTKWNLIARVVRCEFNGRLRTKKQKTGAWRIGYHLIPRSFGKELVLLSWAIEDVTIEKISQAVQNWLGLVPEERWWLYTQANAATGHALKGRGKGWRKAIQIALTENPVTPAETDTSTSTYSISIKKLQTLRPSCLTGEK